ncbi:hypothetical protein MCSV2_50030 [Mucispirillum schaedleri ASF457]|nr:hypothetical protein MCSV2_50030 [Mucispirillum schaedleri ASF457]
MPKKSYRAKSQPKNIPNGRLAATDQNPTRILNFTADSSAWLKVKISNILHLILYFNKL